MSFHLRKELHGLIEDWAAARFREGYVSFELLAMSMSGDLAFTVWIERCEVSVAVRGVLNPMVLRVTHLYRREDGNWKIIHRHADPVIEKTEAPAILQQ
jgi:ketosteroid isomerase-like protein